MTPDCEMAAGSAGEQSRDFGDSRLGCGGHPAGGVLAWTPPPILDSSSRRPHGLRDVQSLPVCLIKLIFDRRQSVRWSVHLPIWWCVSATELQQIGAKLAYTAIKGPSTCSSQKGDDMADAGARGYAMLAQHARRCGSMPYDERCPAFRGVVEPNDTIKTGEDPFFLCSHH